MRKLFIFLTLIYSCTNVSSFKRNLISDEVKKTWVQEAWNELGVYEPIGNYLVFNKDGTFKVYYSLDHYNKGLASPTETLDGPTMSYSWNFGRDSTFKVGSHLFKVVKYNADSIYLKVPGHEGKFLFTRYKL